MTERTAAMQVALRRHSHLLAVQEARAEEIVAGAKMTRAREAAKAGGCSPEEIAGAIRLIERASRS